MSSQCDFTTAYSTTFTLPAAALHLPVSALRSHATHPRIEVPGLLLNPHPSLRTEQYAVHRVQERLSKHLGEERDPCHPLPEVWDADDLPDRGRRHDLAVLCMQAHVILLKAQK